MFQQINHQIPHMIPQMPLYQNSQQQQHMVYPNQMIPHQQHHFQVHTQFVEAEQQIQQEIQQLQQLQLQLKFRQQQFVQSLNTPNIAIPPVNQNPPNNFMSQYNNPNLLQQLQNQAQLNPSNGYNKYQKVMNIEACDPNFSMVPQNQILLNNEIPQQQQQMLQLGKFAHQKQMHMYPGEYLNNSQLNLNKKRNYDLNIQLSKLEDSNETLSPQSMNNFVTKKICTEDIKSSTTLLESNNYINQQSNLQNRNYIQSHNLIAQQTQKYIPQYASETSSTQSLKSKQMPVNGYGMDLSFQNNSAAVNNTFVIKKEAKNEMNAKIERAHQLQEQEQNSSDDSDKRCKKDIQNDSNYTKNLLKGFRRHMNKKFKDNKEHVEKFQQYFYNNTLSNEFILILLESSAYQAEFEEFLQTDPSWWIKEAKIKEPSRQLRFFEIVKNKNYSDIRTKRKGKSSQTIPAPAQAENTPITTENNNENNNINDNNTNNSEVASNQ